MKKTKEILQEIDATSLRPVAHKIIEMAQKEAYNEAIKEVLIIKKRTYDEDGNLYLSADRCKQLLKPHRKTKLKLKIT